MGEYQRRVADRILAEKKRLEEQLGDELPLELPQEGGCTATALVLTPDSLLACWVGDSRAIVADAAGADAADDAPNVVTVGSERLRVTALTTDHNPSNEAERQRLLAAGGSTGKDGMSGHVFVKDAEGGLRVTRSLGDSPFHKGDAVSARPGLGHAPLSTATRFAVVASDGIWDHLSNEQVASLVAEASGAGASAGGDGSSSSSSAAMAACQKVLDHIESGQAAGTLDPKMVDDRGIAVVLLRATS